MSGEGRILDGLFARMIDALDTIGVLPEDQAIEPGPLTAEELDRTEDD